MVAIEKNVLTPERKHGREFMRMNVPNPWGSSPVFDSVNEGVRNGFGMDSRLGRARVARDMGRIFSFVMGEEEKYFEQLDTKQIATDLHLPEDRVRGLAEIMTHNNLILREIDKRRAKKEPLDRLPI